MADYVITCSSTADLPTSFAQEHGITVLPYQFFMDGKEYYDDQGISIPTHEFYEKVRAGSIPTTSMVNAERYVAFFTPFLEAGKDILHLEFSSGLSGSFDNAVMVSEQLMKKYPGRTVKVVDSLSASRGYGLFVHLVVLQKEQGATLEQAAEYAEALRWKITHWFAVESLEHLRRGGRVSRASAFLGTMLNIKPVLAFNNEGKIIPVEKIRGRKKSLITLVDKMEEDIDDPNGQIIYIGHGDALEDAQFVAQLIRERFPSVQDILINYTGPVIGAHSGPGTVNLHYVGKHRVDIQFK
jgi:DegV family protein with EDD domain